MGPATNDDDDDSGDDHNFRCKVATDETTTDGKDGNRFISEARCYGTWQKQAPCLGGSNALIRVASFAKRTGQARGGHNRHFQHRAGVVLEAYRARRARALHAHDHLCLSCWFRSRQRAAAKMKTPTEDKKKSRGIAWRPKRAGSPAWCQQEDTHHTGSAQSRQRRRGGRIRQTWGGAGSRCGRRHAVASFPNFYNNK